MTRIDFMPSLACGRIYVVLDGALEYSGTGARYLRHNIVITAAHCVPDLDDTQFAFKSPFAKSEAWVAERVERHPIADIAVLVGPRGVRADPAPIYSAIDDKMFVEGTDFQAFGYPAEGDTSVGRLFKGHFQRFFGYDRPGGRGQYLAGELSVPAPAGLSGGPVSTVHTPDVLCAVVTANHDSSLVIDSFEETEKNGTVSRGKITRVVSYGIAAMTAGADIGPWINQIVASTDEDGS